jgi:hypothetical protein
MKVMKKSIQKNEDSARKVVVVWKMTPYGIVYICAIASEELGASTFKVIPTLSGSP